MEHIHKTIDVPIVLDVLLRTMRFDVATLYLFTARASILNTDAVELIKYDTYTTHNFTMLTKCLHRKLFQNAATDITKFVVIA